MALNVGVVKIEYVDAPAEPVRGFLFELAGKDLDEGWIGRMGRECVPGDAPRRLGEQSKKYAFSEGGLPQDNREAAPGSLIRALPGKG